MAYTSLVALSLISLLSLCSLCSASSCATYTGCGDCTDDSSCVWCDGSGTCADGSFWGGENACDGWRWRQCKMSGQVPFYGTIVGIVVLLIMVTVATVVVCRARRVRRERYIDYTLFKDDQITLKRAPRINLRRSEMMAKYGIGGTSSESLPHAL